MCFGINETNKRQFSLESYLVVKCFKEEFEFREYAIVSMITYALTTKKGQHRKRSRGRKAEKTFKQLEGWTEKRSFENVQEPDLGRLDTTRRQKAHQSS